MLDKLKAFANYFTLLLYKVSVKIQSHKKCWIIFKVTFPSTNTLSTMLIFLHTTIELTGFIFSEVFPIQNFEQVEKCSCIHTNQKNHSL